MEGLSAAIQTVPCNTNEPCKSSHHGRLWLQCNSVVDDLQSTPKQHHGPTPIAARTNTASHHAYACSPGYITPAVHVLDLLVQFAVGATAQVRIGQSKGVAQSCHGSQATTYNASTLGTFSTAPQSPWTSESTSAVRHTMRVVTNIVQGLCVAHATVQNEPASHNSIMLLLRTSGMPPTAVLTTNSPEDAASTIAMQKASVREQFKNM